MRYRYRSDDELKDSGVEWLGQIPKDWEVTRIKNYTKLISIKGKETLELLSLYRDYGIMPKSYRDDNHNRPSEDLSNYKYVRINNLVLNKMKVWQGSLAVSNYEGIVSPAYIICELDIKKVIPKYIHYLLRNKLYIPEYRRLSTGIRPDQWDINYEDFKNITSFIPNIAEQKKIANFLDEKTSEFESIISKKEMLIEKLEEAKKSLISEVVTGKMKVVETNDGYELVKRSSEEMKDSGVEWLGKIPKDWEVKAIKYLFQLRNERNSKEMKDVQLLSLFTSLGVVKQGEVEARGNKVRTVEDYKEVYSNDIVVNIILAWMGAIGMSEYRGVISPAYDIYKPINSDVVSKYYHYLFRTPRFSGECYKKGRGIMDMRWRTYSDEFKSIIVTSPKVDEKNNIVKCLDKKINNIERLIQSTQNQIEKLKEAKQSLISEAVTGKIEILD